MLCGNRVVFTILPATLRVKGINFFVSDNTTVTDRRGAGSFDSSRSLVRREPGGGLSSRSLVRIGSIPRWQVPLWVCTSSSLSIHGSSRCLQPIFFSRGHNVVGVSGIAQTRVFLHHLSEPVEDLLPLTRAFCVQPAVSGAAHAVKLKLGSPTLCQRLKSSIWGAYIGESEDVETHPDNLELAKRNRNKKLTKQLFDGERWRVMGY
ncbi:hypothetical protein R3P38DRAFT_2867402 [Favolaschia claudopus]|uniref:Uncharacterized protein n=1 Tax=Favolaschia claudopus TaxID=2862362 RepID=A0AAW0DBW7_9AGAR